MNSERYLHTDMKAFLDGKDFDDLTAALISEPRPLPPAKLEHASFREVLRAANNCTCIEQFARQASERIQNRPELLSQLETLISDAVRLRGELLMTLAGKVFTLASRDAGTRLAREYDALIERLLQLLAGCDGVEFVRLRFAGCS